MTEDERRSYDYQLGTLTQAHRDLHHDFQKFKEEDRDSHQKIQAQLESGLTDIKAEMLRQEKKIDYVISNMAWYRHLFTFIKVLLMTMALVATFKFGDIKVLWTTFHSGEIP